MGVFFYFTHHEGHNSLCIIYLQQMSHQTAQQQHQLWSHCLCHPRYQLGPRKMPMQWAPAPGAHTDLSSLPSERALSQIVTVLTEEAMLTLYTWWKSSRDAALGGARKASWGRKPLSLFRSHTRDLQDTKAQPTFAVLVPNVPQCNLNWYLNL